MCVPCTDVGLLVDLSGAVGAPQVLDGAGAPESGIALCGGGDTKGLVLVYNTLIIPPSCFGFIRVPGALTRVLRFPRPSLATDTDTEREKYFPGEALLGLLVMDSWEPDRLRSKASPGTLVGMEDGLRVICILRKSWRREE